MARKITTFLMFEGQAEEAMLFYLSLFQDAEVVSIQRHESGGEGLAGTVQHARFKLAGQEFMCIDSSVDHQFTFTPAISLYVDCADEGEIDRLYNALSEGGGVLMPIADYGFSKKFGWVNDKFGVSWQLNLPA